MKTFIISLIIFSIGAFIGPRTPNSLQSKFCYTNIVVTKHSGITLNCDSPEFIELTKRPSDLFEKNQPRQSRPGLILLSYPIKLLLTPFTVVVNYLKPTSQKAVSDRSKQDPRGDAASYGSYIILNLLILFLAFKFFCLLAGQTKLRFGVCVLGLLIIFNEMTKLFILTPHTQLLNIFVPIFTLWLAYKTYTKTKSLKNLNSENEKLKSETANSKPYFNSKTGYFISLILGLSLLIYGNFLCTFSVFMLINLYLAIKQHKSIGHICINTIGHCAIFALPTLSWIALVLSITGSYYVHEVHHYKYGEWIKIAFSEGGILEVITIYLQQFQQILIKVSQDFIPTLIVGAIIFTYSFQSIIKNYLLRQKIYVYLVLIFISSLSFIGLFASMGYFPPRLTFSLIPLWWPLFGLILQENTKPLFSSKVFNTIFTLAIFAYGAWIIYKPWDFRLW